ncbi:unnamed protein product [Lathyrus oleraceus]
MVLRLETLKKSCSNMELERSKSLPGKNCNQHVKEDPARWFLSFVDQFRGARASEGFDATPLVAYVRE